MQPPEKPKTKSLVIPASTHAAVNAVADDAKVTIQTAADLLLTHSLEQHAEGKFSIAPPKIELTAP